MIPFVSAVMGFSEDDPNVTRREVSEEYVKQSLQNSGKNFDIFDKNLNENDTSHNWCSCSRCGSQFNA